MIPTSLRAVLICEPGNAQALTRIVFDEKLVEIGKGETTYREKTTDTLKVYLVSDYQLLVIHPEHGMKSSFANDLSEQLIG
jgi:hypothetical protein